MHTHTHKTTCPGPGPDRALYRIPIFAPPVPSGSTRQVRVGVAVRLGLAVHPALTCTCSAAQLSLLQLMPAVLLCGAQSSVASPPTRPGRVPAASGLGITGVSDQ